MSLTVNSYMQINTITLNYSCITIIYYSKFVADSVKYNDFIVFVAKLVL
jgi:hypothetical protein